MLKNNLVLFFVCIFSIGVYAQKDIFDICRTGSLEEITKLYEADKTIINLKNEQGYSALTIACYNQNEKVVAFLADKVDSVNEDSKYGSPLMASVYKRNNNIVKILLNHGANVNYQDAKGVTAGHYAVMFKMYDIIESLKKANANFDLKNNKKESARDYAILYNDNKINELLNK